MSLICVERFRADSLKQKFTVKKRTRIQVIRPYLLKALSPAGTLILKLKKDGEIIAEKALTSLDMENSSDKITATNYYRGYISFDFGKVIPLNKGQYEIEISTFGYLFSDAVYFGWIVEEAGNTKNIVQLANDEKDNPFAFEIWAYERDSKI